MIIGWKSIFISGFRLILDFNKMPPNATSIVECTGVLNECDAETIDGGLDKNVDELKHANDRTLKLVWRNILIFGYVHLAAVYGAYLMLTSARIYTGIFGNYFVSSESRASSIWVNWEIPFWQFQLFYSIGTLSSIWAWYYSRRTSTLVTFFYSVYK